MKTRAFTLIELLVVIVIIAVLAAILFPVMNRVRNSGKMAREVSAGRQLVAAFISTAADRDGQFMVGYSATDTATDEKGNPVMNPASGRYPWRLAPYFRYQMRGVLLTNEQEKLATIQNHDDFVYRASLFPSFGINATYVGGNERSGLIPTAATIRFYGSFVATRMNQVTQPAKLIVFASARYTGDDSGASGTGSGDTSFPEQPGFHLLTPPRTTKIEWSGTWDRKMPAEKFGSLDLRYSDRAVCVMLAGNVEMLDQKELQDMRHWSVQAAETDNPDFILKPL
jgi:prepilin-type N-terminal cleavage/methylation domain-containing protein